MHHNVGLDDVWALQEHHNADLDGGRVLKELHNVDQGEWALHNEGLDGEVVHNLDNLDSQDKDVEGVHHILDEEEVLHILGLDVMAGVVHKEHVEGVLHTLHGEEVHHILELEGVVHKVVHMDDVVEVLQSGAHMVEGVQVTLHRVFLVKDQWYELVHQLHRVQLVQLSYLRYEPTLVHQQV